MLLSSSESYTQLHRPSFACLSKMSVSAVIVISKTLFGGSGSAKMFFEYRVREILRIICAAISCIKYGVSKRNIADKKFTR